MRIIRELYRGRGWVWFLIQGLQHRLTIAIPETQHDLRASKFYLILQVSRDRKDVSTSVGDPNSMIRMFLGLSDPHPDPLVTSMDPDPSIIKQK
jgi:hypothetical protein